MPKFEKTYSRDTSLIIQQAWFAGFWNDQKNFGWMNPHRPAMIHVLRRGVVEVWENADATEWFVETLLKRNIEDSAFFDGTIAAYREQTAALEAYWTKGAAFDVDELKKVIDLMFDAMIGFIVMYYSSLDERTPEKIRTEALALRDVDAFFDKNDRFIRQSLTTLYPQISGIESGVLRSEIGEIPDVETLQKRQQSFIVLGEEAQWLMSLSAFVAEHLDHTFVDESIEIPTTDEIRGRVACPGRARGKVRVVLMKKDIGLVEEGEILVSTMTTPDFVPAIQKCAAIITDEGGITCHAAIVSRELKKPCIIGTKIATKGLKDGDVVEVDAERGIVRIIS